MLHDQRWADCIQRLVFEASRSLEKLVHDASSSTDRGRVPTLDISAKVPVDKSVQLNGIFIRARLIQTDARVVGVDKAGCFAAFRYR